MAAVRRMVFRKLFALFCCLLVDIRQDVKKALYLTVSQRWH